MIVYLITNIVNGKYYVGKSMYSAKYRWSQHLAMAKKRTYYFANAIKKYGSESFIVEELSNAETNEQLLELERLWIISLRSYDPKVGYNSTYGGEGTLDTIETRKKKSLSHIGKSHSTLVKIAIGKAHLGKPRPESVKDAVSRANMGNKHCVGRTLSLETRAKISESLRKRNNVKSEYPITRSQADSSTALISPIPSRRYLLETTDSKL